MAGGAGAIDASRVRQLELARVDGRPSEFVCSFSRRLSSTFGVRGIPALIVVSATDGAVLAQDGRGDVMRHGAAAFAHWHDLAKGASDQDTNIVEQLKDNPPEVMREAGEILLKLLGNVRRDPMNMKYRQIRLSNPKIESKLLAANGAFEILFSVGFEEVRLSHEES